MTPGICFQWLIPLHSPTVETPISESIKKKKPLNIFLEIIFAFSSQSPDNYVMKHTFLLLTKESLLSKSKMETTHTHVRNSPSLPLLPSGLKSRG